MANARKPRQDDFARSSEWSEEEKARFEEAFGLYGKKFHRVQRAVCTPPPPKKKMSLS